MVLKFRKLSGEVSLEGLVAYHVAREKKVLDSLRSAAADGFISIDY